MIDINIKGARAGIEKLRLIGDSVNPLSQELIMDIASDAAQQVKFQVQIQNHIFTGNLLKSIRAEKVEDKSAQIKMNFYGLFVDRGTKGSDKKAPPQLVRWVIAKFNPKTLLDKFQGDPQKAADSIRRSGTKAHEFVQNALEGYDPSPFVADMQAKLVK